MRDKGEVLRKEEGAGVLNLEKKAKKNQRGRERRFLRENSKESKKSGDLSLRILDFLKRIR